MRTQKSGGSRWRSTSCATMDAVMAASPMQLYEPIVAQEVEHHRDTSKFCVLVIFDIYQGCCNNMTYEFATHGCCNGTEVSTAETHTCCNGQVIEKSLKGCCGPLSQSYDKATQGCFDGVIYTTSVSDQGAMQLQSRRCCA